MSIEAQLFDGTVLEFPDGTERSVIESTVQRLTAERRPKDDSSDLVRGFKAYPSGLQETFGGAQALLGVGAEKTFGKSGVSDYLIERGTKNLKEAEAEQQRTAKPTDEFTNAWEAGIGTVITDWLPYQIGSGAANLLETAAVAATGAVVGSIAVPGAGTLGGGLTGFVSKKLIQNGIKEAAEKVLKERGKDAAEAFIQAESKKVVSAEVAALAEAGAKKAIGSGAAMVGQAGFHGMGEVTSGAVQEAERQGLTARDIDLGRVLPAVAIHSAADFISNKIGLGALDGLAAPTKSMLLNVAKSIGVTGFKEVPPELLQTAMELYGAGLPLDDQEAINKYINTAAAAFGMSVVPGGIGGMRSRVVEKAAAPDQTGLDQTNALGQTPDQLGQQTAIPLDNFAPANPADAFHPAIAGQSLLALPAPATLVEPEPMQTSLQNPLGSFTYDNFTPVQIKALNDLRKAEGKPKLPQTFSIEDIADLSPAKGVLDSLITAKSGYNGEQVTFQQLIDIAQLKNIDITTQGFRDFLRRATGTEKLEDLSPPQLFAATKALDSVQPFEEMTILPADVSNATHYTPDQYNKAIGGIDLAFKEIEGKPLGRQAMLTEIKDFTGLKDRDAERILQQAIREGHIEQRDEVRNVNGEQKVVPSFMPAQNVEQLPGGMDIRKQKFKQADGSTKEQFVYYDNDEPVAKFDDQYQAERYGITQQPDNVLDRIVKSYKDQRGLRAQRYGALAEREIESRKNPEINRAVTTKQGEEGATERLGELGITYVEFKPEVKEALPEIMNILAPALNKLGLSRIGIKLADTIDNGGTDGFYFKGIITIALDQDNPLGIMRHEVIHALKALGVFTPSELKTLEKFAKKSLAEGQFFDQKMQDLYKEKYLQTHPDLNGFDEYMQEEVMAEAFRYFTGNKPPAGFFQNMMYRLNAMFRAIGNAFRSVKLTTPEQIFADIESGEIGSRTGTAEVGQPRYSINDKKETAPEGIPQNLFDLQRKYAKITAMANERIPSKLNSKGVAPRTQDLKREETMSFRRLNKAVEDYVGVENDGDTANAAYKMLVRLAEASNKFNEDNDIRYSLVRPAVAGETEISTQNPQGAKRKYDPITQMLSIDEAAVREGMKLNPKNKKAIISAIKGYGFIPNDTPDSQVIEVFKQNIVNNLLYLYNSVPEDTRQRSKLWYDGANRMAIDMGKAFGVTKEQVAGIMAAMSPQKDWFQNVSMAERALDVLTTQGNKAWDANMLKYAESYVNEAKDRAELEKRQIAFEQIKKVAKKGTVLDKMNANDAAAFIRAYDEAFNSRDYRIVTPEGGFGGFVTKANGEPATMMWSTYDPIKKSVLIYRDGSRPNISNQLGEEHKIRSFYNNIAAPKSDIGHVTIDTHAVAAALFEALAGSDEPVTHNFGGTGKSSLIGVGGTYGIIADAYRTAAAQVGMLPREMQSITWEAVRGLFNADIKNTIKPKIRDEWSKYKKGELSFEQARENAVKIATSAQGVTDNKIPEPDWKDSGKGKFVSAGGTSYDKSFKPEGGVRLRPKESIREKLSVNLAAVTESIPGLKELYERAKGKDLNAYKLLQRVAEARLRFLLGGTKAKITVDDIKGVFLGDREPSIASIIAFDESEMKPVLAALAQFAESFNQIQVHVRQPTAYEFGHKYGDGSYATAVYRIELKKSLNEATIAQIIEESGLKGFSVSKDTLTAYWVDNNVKGSEDEFAKQIKQVNDLVGKLDSKPKQSIERLFVYGTKDSGAPIGYDKISGDLRTAEGSDTKTAKLIADYLEDGDIKPFKQKPLTQGQTKDQKLLYQIFTKLPNNDLKNPLVRKAYNHLTKDLIKQYKTLPIKAEVVTDVTLDGKTYSYFGKESKKLKDALSRGMTEAEADQAIKYLVDNYGEPNPAWTGMLGKIKRDESTLYGNIADNMRRDVSENNRLKVYKTSPETFGPKGSNFAGHPLLKDSGLKDINGYPMLFNDLLRVVHDYYAHNLSNATFGPSGEFAAQRNHMAVTPDPWSRWAIIAETRAQNAWQNFRPEVEGMSLMDRPYAAQKAALPPIDFVLTGDEKLDAPVRVLMDELTPAQRLGSLKESDAKDFKGTSVKPPKPPKTAEKENVESPAGASLAIRPPSGPVNEPLITKVGTQATTKQQVTTAYEETVKAYKSSDLRQKARIALVDPSSALAQSLAALPHFDMNGTLRGDMVYHAGKQGINLIKNGMVTGDVVVNKDGSLVVKDSKDNLAAAAKLADSIDNNPYVRATTDKGRSVSGRQYVGEVARILRGADIIADDAQTRADGLAKIAASKAMYKRVKGMPLTKQRVALVRQMAKLRSEGLKESKVNREKQVNKAQIAWAEHQLKSVPEVKEILRIWKAVNTGLVDLHESVGILSKERADEFRGRDRYVPLFKAREDLEDTVFNFSGTGAKSVAKGHKLEGSEAIRNIWENVDKQYASMVATAYENQTRKVAAEQLISLSPPTGSKFAEITKNPKDSRINLRYLEDGKIVNVIVENPNDVAAFQMMNYELGPIMKAVSGLSKTLRVGALLNPMFWLKQLIRDPIHATIVAGTGVITPFHSARGFIKILSKNSKEADILARHGVIGAYDSTLSMAQYLKDVGKEGSTPSGMQRLFHKLMTIHEASDAATRVEIFKKAKADGIKKGMTEEDAINYGVFKAREAINFAVHGNSSTINQLRHAIPFFSAALTSLDTVYRAATGFGLSGKEKAEAKAQFKRRAMMMFLMSLAYAFMLQGDEEYEKLPDYVKDNNWLMPNPVGKGFIKFATPFEVGFLFKTIPEVMVRTMAGTSTGKEAIASIQKGLIQNLPGGGVIFSQAIKPAVEVITNHSFFTGNPVESIGDQGKSVANRGQRASETAKMLSRFGLDNIGLSPAKIDHLIQGYFAELGTFTTSAVDTLIYSAEGKTPPAKNFESMQALKPFLTDRNVNKAVSDFYEIEKSAREVVADLNDMKKKGMIKDIRELVGDEEKRKQIAIEPMLRKTMEGMAKIRAQIGYLRENEAGMTPEARRDRINELTQYMNQYAAQGVKAAKSMGLR